MDSTISPLAFFQWVIRPHGWLWRRQANSGQWMFLLRMSSVNVTVLLELCSVISSWCICQQSSFGVRGLWPRGMPGWNHAKGLQVRSYMPQHATCTHKRSHLGFSVTFNFSLNCHRLAFDVLLNHSVGKSACRPYAVHFKQFVPKWISKRFKIFADWWHVFSQYVSCGATLDGPFVCVLRKNVQQVFSGV